VISYPQLPSQEFRSYLDGLPSSGSIAILCDGDVDGLGAGVTLAHCLERTGVEPSRIVNLHVPKGGNAYTQEVKAKVDAVKPSALCILDLGVRDFELAPGVPKLMIDHHRPKGSPQDSTVICGYDWEPPPTSSLLTYLLCSEVVDLQDVGWKAAIGNAGDLGPEYAPFSAMARAVTKKAFDEAKSLINSAKRSSDPDLAIPIAFRLLHRAQTPKELLKDDSAEAKTLRALQAEVKEEFAHARRLAPKFSKTQPIALFRFSSPARVHPLLAQSWRLRLPKFVVMAANDGFVEGRVNFSMRTAADINILDLLEKYGEELGIDEPEYGLGHNQASGGSLKREMFERLLEKMGFEESGDRATG
jgi:single-stranded-DNA-specific exonuclease